MIEAETEVLKMEGPSVHLAARQLSVLEGQTIQEFHGNTPRSLVRLQGEEIERVQAVGNRLFIDTTGPSMVADFNMDGSYSINKNQIDPEELVISCSRDTFSLSIDNVNLLDPDSDEYREHNQPNRDVLSEDFDRKRALNAMGSDNRVIADVLLDQDIFGGVGSIIRNEALHATKIDPKTVSSSIPRKKAEELIRQVIEFANGWLEMKTKSESLSRVQL